MNKTDKFKERIFSLVGTDFELLSEFVNYKTKVLLRHNKCGREFSVSPTSFVHQNTRCAMCSGRLKITEDIFIERLEATVGTEYRVLGKYVNFQTKVEMEHNVCGYTWNVLPSNFLNKNSRCPKCSGNAKVTDEDFKKRVYNMYKNEYVFLEPFINTITPILCKHSCGYEWKITPGNFLAGKGCPKCSGSMKLTQEEFNAKVYELFKDEYKFLEPYINTMTSIMCEHSCGYKWKLRPDNLFQGKRCPNCYNESKGEQFIRGLLDSLGVEHETQKTFECCVYKNKLRFDFYIPELNLAIEYDGEHHFKPITYNRNIEESNKTFEIAKKRDSIKTNYCEDNNISLIRFPYTDSKEVITEKLKSLLNSTEVKQGD